MVQVTPISALRDNYVWCLSNEQSNYCVLIDPGEARPVTQFLHQHQIIPAAVMITHHHPDHCGGLPQLKELYPNMEIYARDPQTVPHCTQSLQDGESVNFDFLAATFEAISIPGHTLDHTAYYTPGLVFTGDTLFTGGCGKFFEGTPKQMFHSLQRLAQLPLETLIYSGHEYTEKNLRFAQQVEPNNADITTRLEQVARLRQSQQPTVPATLAVELKTNPFLRTHQPDVRTAVNHFTSQSLNDQIDILAGLRYWKNCF